MIRSIMSSELSYPSARPYLLFNIVHVLNLTPPYMQPKLCVSPTADHHKWKRKGLSLYYACVVANNTSNNNIENAANNNDGGVVGDSQQIICALRAATDCNNNHNNRSNVFLIDYIYTHPSHREHGIAGKLIGQILQMVKQPQPLSANANTNTTILGVLSIEESCVYWLEKWNFVLCQNSMLNGKLNVFPDTHLLIHRDCSNDDVALLMKNGYNGNGNDNKVGGGDGNDGNGNDASVTSTTMLVPPEAFVSCLKELLQTMSSATTTTTSNPYYNHNSGSSILSTCLTTLATIIHNAKYDTTSNNDDHRRYRTIRINNPKIHERVFSVGGESAMKLLQVCGWELGVNDNGDAVLNFVNGGSGDGDGDYMWLDAAVSQLEYEGGKHK